jgi:hypothetical protein
LVERKLRNYILQVFIPTKSLSARRPSGAKAGPPSVVYVLLPEELDVHQLSDETETKGSVHPALTRLSIGVLGSLCT